MVCLVRTVLFLLFLLPLDSSGEVPAAESDAIGDRDFSALAIDLVRGRAAEIAASSGLDEASKTTLADLYRRSIGALEAADAYREAAQRFESKMQSAPADTEKVRAEVARVRAEVDAETQNFAKLSLAELEQLLLEEKGAKASLESGFNEVNNQILKAQERPVAIRQRLSDANIAINEAESVPAAQGLADELPELGQARRWADEARSVELRAEILMLSQELASHPMRLALLQAQRDLAEVKLGAVQRRIEKLEALTNEVRLNQSEQAKIKAQVAELVASDKAPLVAELAGRNTRLSKDVEVLAGEIKDIKREEREAVEQARHVEESFSATRKKIEVAGVSLILGQVLQEQRRSLPDTAKAKRMARDREGKIARTALRQILLEEERDELGDTAAYVEKLSSSLSSEVQADIADELRQLAVDRLGLINQALKIQHAYLNSMAELDIAQRRLEEVVDQFGAFLAEHLLWVRSSQVAGLESMRLIPGQLADLLAPDKWRSLITALPDAVTTAWVVLALLVALALWMRRRRLWQALRDSGKNVGSLLRDRLGDTLRAFGIMLLIALPWPLLLFATGRGLVASNDAADFAKIVGQVLISISLLAFQLMVLRVFVAPGSVADAHFGWRDRGLERLHRDLRWFSPMLVLIGAFTILSFATTTQYWGSGLARAAFVATMALIAAFFFRFSRPDRGALSILFAQHQESSVFRLRHGWFLILVGSPLAAAGVSLAGFMYTAGTLINHILNTVWLGLLIIVVHQFVIRWLVLNQRKMRLQAARERRRAEQEARGTDDEPEETEGVLARDLEEPELDLHALDAASRKLANNAFLLLGLIGIWAIWRDMLPALGILDEVTLWSYSKPGVDGVIPITLSSVGLAISIFVIMVVATRQLPAFLELALLQRLDMTRGSRYTVATLTKYTVVAVGVAWIFSTLGGSWSEIQWIFAALGVGIGFGLQEIVANFVSGLIILFERPIRVGDVVTVGNTDGVVTRIRIRATTIRNWDQKELLVPNKNFITQELLNWSLSDQTTRILIRVGIAYGSNVERALLIIEEAAAAHPRVMTDPAPFVVFEEFGDNALLLSLRCYIDDIDHRLRTTTDINLAINQGMADAGIEIAFPQRDIHLDTRRPLDVRIQAEQTQGEP